MKCDAQGTNLTMMLPLLLKKKERKRFHWEKIEIFKSDVYIFCSRNYVTFRLRRRRRILYLGISPRLKAPQVRILWPATYARGN